MPERIPLPEDWGNIELTPIKPEEKSHEKELSKFLEKGQESAESQKPITEKEIKRREFLSYLLGAASGVLIYNLGERYLAWQNSINKLQEEIENDPQKRDEMLQWLKKRAEAEISQKEE